MSERFRQLLRLPAPRFVRRLVDGQRPDSTWREEVAFAEYTRGPQPKIRRVFELLEAALPFTAVGLSEDEAQAEHPRIWGETERAPMPWIVYACDPNHPARARQVADRLRIVGTTLVHERGRLGDDEAPSWPERVEAVELGTRAAVEARLDAQQRRWLEAGAWISDDPVALFRALSPHAPSLCRAVQLAPADELDAALAVLDDWRQDQGVSWLRPEVDRAWSLGPLRPLVGDCVRLEWTGRAITGLELEIPGLIRVSSDRCVRGAALLEILRLPAVATLRWLRLCWRERGESLAAYRDALAEAAVVEGLSRLELELSTVNALDSFAEHRLAAVEELCVSVGMYAPSTLDLPRLRILDLSVREDSEPLCSALASGAFARLEVLRLQILGNHNYEEVPSQMMIHLLQGLVDRPLPALRVVELRVVYWRTRGEADVLARAPWLSQLERLVVRGWQFEPEAEEALRALGSCVELETVGPHVHELV